MHVNTSPRQHYLLFARARACCTCYVHIYVPTRSIDVIIETIASIIMTMLGPTPLQACEHEAGFTRQWRDR
eukprot:1672178-Pyramimonas_sp.AAC.1